MFISPDIYSLVLGPWKNIRCATRCNRLRADLDAFISGQKIGVAPRPYQTRGSLLAQLGPERDEVWEIRSCDPKPGIRVFGRFFEVDHFVALTWYEKDDDLDYSFAIRECRAKWRKLFHPYEPLSGSSPNDYLSGNFFLVRNS